MASLLASRLASARQRDYSPVPWHHYFDEAHDVKVDPTHCNNNDSSSNDRLQNSFRVYLRNFKPPYASNRKLGTKLDASQCDSTQEEFHQNSQIPTLVALHGGGYSALTWAQFTRYIERHCHCRILAIDLRGHGDTQTSADDLMDADTLVADVIQITHAVHKLCGFPETPKLILIGHSMGGAIAVKCSAKCAESLPSLAGFVIIDVVEGTAKDALPLMMSVIRTRPTKFPTLSNAIEWSVRSGMAKNAEAARVSMPGNLLNIASGHLSIHDIALGDETESSSIEKHKFHISIENLLASRNHNQTSLPKGLPLPPRIKALRGGSFSENRPPLEGTRPSSPTAVGIISEADTSFEECQTSPATSDSDRLDSDGYTKPPELDQAGYCWRTDLAKTQPFWNGWFDGLSQQLLDAPVQGKFLLLAGIDRLDKTLTIGQMQGKFMMKVLPKCGHAVHEDVPEQVASVIGQFLVRNKFTTACEEDD